MKTLYFFCYLAATVATTPSWASEEEIFSQTTHETTIGGRSIVYTATVGSIPTRSTDGKETGKIFYTAYRQEGETDYQDRPITFAFNGGPGSSSVWLHMGALGPKRVMNKQEGQSIAPPYCWVENEDSILDLTDLVFIDPMGTGLSRTSDETDVSFYEMDGDISSIGDFIRDYVTMEGRWKSPKYLAGESYGTLRACGAAEYLLSRHGLYLNGLILISCAIDFQTLICDIDNELPYSLYLPSFAAAAWYHGRLDQNLSLEETVASAKDFALNTLAPSLMRQGKVAPSLFPEIAHWTGLPLDLIERNDGLIDSFTFFLQLLGREKKVIGRFDSRSVGEILPPRNMFNYEDPSEWTIQGIYSGALHAYLQEELGCKAAWPRYEVISYLPWDYTSFGYPNTMNQLRRALVMNPDMRVFTACGYFDLATPLAATEHCFRRLHLPIDDNITFGYYEGGHMFYTNLAALKKFKTDLVVFYTGKKI